MDNKEDEALFERVDLRGLSEEDIEWIKGGIRKGVFDMTKLDNKRGKLAHHDLILATKLKGRNHYPQNCYHSLDMLISFKEKKNRDIEDKQS